MYSLCIQYNSTEYSTVALLYTLYTLYTLYILIVVLVHRLLSPVSRLYETRMYRLVRRRDAAGRREKTLGPQPAAPARAAWRRDSGASDAVVQPVQEQEEQRRGGEGRRQGALADAGNGRYLVEIEAKEYNGNISVRDINEIVEIP